MIDIFNNILTNVLTALYQPFWFAILLSVFFMFFWLYSHEDTDDNNAAENSGSKDRIHQRGYKQAAKYWIIYFKTSSTFRRTFLFVFYISMILFRTLLNRNMWMNPLSKVLGGWWIYEESNGEITLTTECFENVMLMVPFTVLLMWAVRSNVRTKLLKDMKLSTVLWQSVKITFLFSFTIEFLQLFLRLGTWQLSDIFYNTLGGFIGGLIYWICYRVKHRENETQPHGK